MLSEGRMEKGMPQYKWLSEDQIRQLHAYLRARAREALGKREPYDPAKAKNLAETASD
jgi:quinohemoprotein ethanol dehydrogenase